MTGYPSIYALNYKATIASLSKSLGASTKTRAKTPNVRLRTILKESNLKNI
jgi:hypothetical protein